jgi:hypothetical protein
MRCTTQNLFLLGYLGRHLGSRFLHLVNSNLVSTSWISITITEVRIDSDTQDDCYGRTPNIELVQLC